jgi:hypothetical protein
MITKSMFWPMAAVLVTALGSADCSRSDSADSGGVADEQVSGMEPEAQDAVMAEVMKRWTKGPEGWITARSIGTSFAPVEFLRQLREIAVDGVRLYELSDSDRLNGFEWAGEVRFKQAPCREAGEPGVLLDGLVGLNLQRQRGRWSQWVEFEPEAVRAQKVKGRWQVNDDTWMLRGRRPNPQDFAKAGVN